jgi:hypothetical protein
MPAGRCPAGPLPVSNILPQKRSHGGFEEPGDIGEESIGKRKGHFIRRTCSSFWLGNIL